MTADTATRIGRRLRLLVDRVLARFGYERILPADRAAVNLLLWERAVARSAAKWSQAEQEIDLQGWVKAIRMLQERRADSATDT